MREWVWLCKDPPEAFFKSVGNSQHAVIVGIVDDTRGHRSSVSFHTITVPAWRRDHAQGALQQGMRMLQDKSAACRLKSSSRFTSCIVCGFIEQWFCRMMTPAEI
jgi:hypothetical protein